MSLRKRVERMLPDWESWYPSLFHAAEDLGIIRPRVCQPAALLLSTRHSGVQSAAIRAYREKWGGEIDDRERMRSQERSTRQKARAGKPSVTSISTARGNRSDRARR